MFTLTQDPREYLPFLRELRALDQYYQRFRIDDHLKRYEKALKNLSLAGSCSPYISIWTVLVSVPSHTSIIRSRSVWGGCCLRWTSSIVRGCSFDMEKYRAVWGKYAHRLIFTPVWLVLHSQNILDTYGDWLFERREFRQAAIGKSMNQWIV